jgi:hypothetical protein
MNRHHVIMNHGGRSLGFPRKPLPRRTARGKMWRQDFDRYGSVQSGIERLEDDTHTTLAENLHDCERTEPTQVRRVIRHVEKVEGDGILGWGCLLDTLPGLNRILVFRL